MQVIVAYVFLWAVEGAARKWAPGADQLFYFARDGFLLAAFTLFLARTRPIRRTSIPIAVLLFGVALTISAAISIIADGSTLQVAVIGVRGYIAPILLVAFAAAYAPRRTVPAVIEAISVIALLNLPLVIAQVASPAYASINAEVGGGEARFINAGDVVRASGTFTSPSGLTAFLGLAAATSLAALLLNSRLRALHFAALGSITLMTILGGSRGAVLSLGTILVVAVLFMLLEKPGRAFKLLAGMTTLVLTLYFAAAWAYPAVVESFLTRFDQAAAAESTGDRIFGGVFDFVSQPFATFGDGPGTHSAAANQSGGFEWIEVESLRWLGELGLLGYALAMGRLIVAVGLVALVIKRRRDLPISATLILGFLVPVILAGSITQPPSSQGAVSIAGTLLYLVIANDPSAKKNFHRFSERLRARDEYNASG